MIPEAPSSTSAPPDRLFARASTCALLVGAVCIMLSHLLLYRSFADSLSAYQQAGYSSERAASARTLAAMLDGLGVVSDVNLTDAARAKLTLAAKRIAAGKGAGNPADQRGSLELTTTVSAFVARVAEFAEASPLDRSTAQELRTVLTGEIIPRLNHAAAGDRLLSDEARRHGTLVLTGSLILHLVAGTAIFLLIFRPAQQEIVSWVHATRETDSENRFRLLHNALTGMPNHTYLHAHLTRVAAASDRRPTQTAVLRVDFDKFRLMRETLGVQVCDEVIRIAARRIQKVLRAGDFAAYLGQDDFVVVTAELADAATAATIAGRIQAAVTKPFVVRGGARKLSCSIGVTLLSDDEADAGLILANAEIALMEAQAEGPGLVRYFSKTQREEVERRETLYQELTQALESGDIIAYFQPQIDLQSGKFSGFEALVRWAHPAHGLLNPASFLEFADQSDLTERLGEVVLVRTMQALRAWDEAGLNVPKVGVNFALAQLRNPRLIERIKWDAESFDIEPGRLAIEVLETVLIKSDADMVVRNLRGLASAGFGIELDDFGTGHASISNLRRFMVDRIKIDRSFVLGIETSEEQQQLTRSMIAMAQALGIETLAEGVETEEAELMLRSLGCSYCQGYIIARPMAFEDTGPWLESYSVRSYAAGGSKSV